MKRRILQANLNNSGGAFSVAYEAQKQLTNEYVFDYFFPDPFIKNRVYEDLISMGSRCLGEIKCTYRIIKQYKIYKKFYQYLKDSNYEFVHIHSDTAWKILIYFIAAKRAKIDNIVVHSHSSGINGHYRLINYILHFLCKQIIKKAKYKCACSENAAKWMFGSIKKVHIIHNGVDIDKFKFNEIYRREIRSKYSIQEKTKVIGSVSDFSYQKNPEFIYKLIKIFRDKKDYYFLFVGNKDNCHLKKCVENDSSIKNVIFVGQVTDVEKYLSSMDIFILPSRFEGLPMCALEAQVNGLFTIVSDKITAETKKSQYFCRIPLNIEKWKNFILQNCAFYDRSEINHFLNEELISSLETADGFRKIYNNEASCISVGKSTSL